MLCFGSIECSLLARPLRYGRVGVALQPTCSSRLSHRVARTLTACSIGLHLALTHVVLVQGEGASLLPVPCASWSVSRAAGNYRFVIGMSCCLLYTSPSPRD
eukprot:13793116-Alexandrium_andersonii.AAC.1